MISENTSERIITEDSLKGLLIKNVKRFFYIDQSKNEEIIRKKYSRGFAKSDDNIPEIVDIVKEVVDYHTYKEWLGELDGGKVKYFGKTTRAKKEIVYRFIKNYLFLFIVKVFEELVKGNTVVLGKGYLKMWMREKEIITKNGPITYLYFEVRTKVTKIRYNVMMPVNLINYIKKLNYKKNAKPVYNA